MYVCLAAHLNSVVSVRELLASEQPSQQFPRQSQMAPRMQCRHYRAGVIGRWFHLSRVIISTSAEERNDKVLIRS